MPVMTNSKLTATSPFSSLLGRLENKGFLKNKGKLDIKGLDLRRWAYNLDSLDDRWTLANRGINVEQDIDIEFVTGPTVNFSTSRTVISQTLTTTQSAQEFMLFISTTGNLVWRVGGASIAATPAILVKPNSKYRWNLSGSTVTIYENGVPLATQSFSRGAVREPSAVTTIGATVNTFYYQGALYNIKINGALWPMADRNQTIQLPEPSGLGDELITPTVLENPAAKGSQWTYLGSGRWQYVGDGTLNDLAFIALANIPNQGYLEFEIESVTGEIRCSSDTANVVGNRLNVTTGIKRVYYLTKPSNFSFARNGTSIASCIIKNISFKPLGTCNPMTGINLNPDRWVEIPL